MSDTDCILADPESTATHGMLDEDIGIATLGWIIRIKDDPIISYPIGDLIADPERDWWYRKDNTDPWFGPLSYRDANSQARRMTMDADALHGEVKYSQLGTVLGTRGGDPQVSPDMFVVYLYVNGKMTLGGRMAEFNQDKLPVL